MNTARLFLGSSSLLLGLALTACSGSVSGGGGSQPTSTTSSTGGGGQPSVSTGSSVEPSPGETGCGVFTGGGGAGGGTTVDPGGPAQPGTGGAGGGTTVDPGGPELPPTSAIAITAQQLGYTTPPDTTYILLGDPAPTCATPTASENGNGCLVAYSVSIGIPASLLKVGTIELSNTSLYSDFSESSGGSSGACSGGGGSFPYGSIDITSITATSVSFTLTNTMATDFGLPNVDGSYVAPRCASTPTGD